MTTRRIARVVGRLAAAWVVASLLGAFAALGPARLARADVTLTSVLGTVGTVVALAGLCWLWLTGFRRWWARTLAAPVGLIVVVVAASPPGIAVWAAYPTSPALGDSRPVAAEDVVIPCGDVTLAAWYLPTENGAAVVLSHGSGSTRASVVAHAQALHDAGYGVLAVDARGHGESTGSPMALGWWGEADLDCAVDALVDVQGVDPDRVGLVGLSMGGEESIGAAGVDPRVAAVVAEGATARTAADKDGWLPGHALGQLQRVLDAERDLILNALTAAPEPASLSEAVAASDAPVLLITAGEVPNEALAAQWLAADADVEVWQVEGAGHTGGLATAGDEWTRRVTEFLDDALLAENRT